MVQVSRVRFWLVLACMLNIWSYNLLAQPNPQPPSCSGSCNIPWNTYTGQNWVNIQSANPPCTVTVFFTAWWRMNCNGELDIQVTSLQVWNTVYCSVDFLLSEIIKHIVRNPPLNAPPPGSGAR